MKASTHFIGIGGTGLSAIARVLLERGESVSGSDSEDSTLAQALRKTGAEISFGHVPENVNSATRVIRSSAVPDDNVEVVAAESRGIPVFKRAEVLGDLLAGKQTIAVAGSHGKTTTTAMLAWILTALNKNPGYILGSVSQNMQSNASAGKGDLFVIEADEYDYMFLGLNPAIALVTNVEHDHPDCFPTQRDFQEAFERFADRLQPDGTLIACADDEGARALGTYAKAQGKNTMSYAIYSDDAAYRAADTHPLPDAGFAFTMLRKSQELAEVKLQVPGKHNVQNAVGALAVADLLGLDMYAAAHALADFRGTARRFDLRGEAAGVLIVDDYAHHPTEIRAALSAARARYPGRRILAVWQPHTYSRTLTLLDDFAAAFGDADRVLVTPVFAAREQQPENFNIQDLVSRFQHKSLDYVPDLHLAESLLLAELKSGDLLLVLSAGDAINLSSAVFKKLVDKE